MQQQEFDALAKQGFNRIPLVKEVLADLETPLSLYVKLTQSFGKQNTYLLESVLGGERFGRFSFIGLPAKTAQASCKRFIISRHEISHSTTHPLLL